MMSNVEVAIIVSFGFVVWFVYSIWDDGQKQKLAIDIITQLRAQRQFATPLRPDYLADKIDVSPKHSQKILGRLTTSGELEWNSTARAFFILPRKLSQEGNNYYGK